MTPRPPIGLLDTSVVIDLPRLTEDALPVFATISAITLAELSAGPQVAPDPATAQARQLVLQQAEASFDPLPFDAACARRFATVTSALRNSGRKTRARAFDALIAATAAENNMVLCSSNAKHLRPIRDLKLKVFRP